MRNKYAELFKNMNENSWKEIRDQYTTLKDFQKYLQQEIPSSTLRYYDNKFNYKPIPSIYRKELGHKYGHLTVIAYDKTENHCIYWKCKCDCGNEVVREGSELRRLRTKDHMCEECNKKAKSLRFWKDLTGQVINQLQVLKRVGENSQGNVIYECKCLNCGNIIEVNSSALGRKNPQISCGCINSQGEYKINILLNLLQIKYKTQYSFPDCKYILPLKFDFAIFNSNNKVLGVIEFQGRQHYTNIGINWKNYDYEASQERDKIKRQYCLEHNIPLKEIPYTDYNLINETYLLNLIESFKLIQKAQD